MWSRIWLFYWFPLKSCHHFKKQMIPCSNCITIIHTLIISLLLYCACLCSCAKRFRFLLTWILFPACFGICCWLRKSDGQILADKASSWLCQSTWLYWIHQLKHTSPFCIVWALINPGLLKAIIVVNFTFGEEKELLV